MSFWGELKRRNVFKVGAAYVIVAWLLTQIASTVFQVYQMPAWTVTFVTTILIIGFPVALLFAWAFELTPDGLKKTEHVPLEESITHLTGKKLDYILIGVIILAVAYILFDNFYLDRRAIETEVASRVAEFMPPADDEEAEKTIAVLPFADLSPEKDQEYFVDGLSEEILNSLAQIPDLTVIARTSSFSFKGTTKKIQEIADELGVAHILEGSVRKAGNTLRITAQLVKGADGSHLWSKTYDRTLEDIFAVQEDIASTVADELKVTLGIGESFKQLGGTDNVEAYEQYLIAKAIYREGPASVSRAREPIDAAISIDPEFALGWVLKANIYGSIETIPDRQNIVLKASQKAIELEPRLPSAWAGLGSTKTWFGEFVEGKKEINKALEMVTEPSLRYQTDWPLQYMYVGHLDEGKEVIKLQLKNDPLNSNFHQIYLKFLVNLGHFKQFEEEYERGRSLHGDQWDTDKVFITRFRLLCGKVMSTDNILCSNSINDAAKENLESPDDAITELRRIYRNSDDLTSWDIDDIISWVSYFGFPDLAMDIIEEELLKSNRHWLEVVWSPVMHKVRQLPRFKEFVREIGLVDYWEKFGWPDLCHPTDDGDFLCD